MIEEKSMKNKIITKCCDVAFEKEEYMKALINNNSQPEYTSKFNLSNTLSYIKCICGNLLGKFDLKGYFDNEEIEQIFEHVLIARKNSDNKMEDSKSPKPLKNQANLTNSSSCFICKKGFGITDEKIYICNCGNKGHINCRSDKDKDMVCEKCKAVMKIQDIENSLKKSSEIAIIPKDGFKTPCCQDIVNSKEFYISDFIELNQKKKKENEKISLEKMFCPLCDKTISRSDLEKILSGKDVEKIIIGLFNKICPECKTLLNDEDPYIKFDCGHVYHIFCATFIRSSPNKKCRLANCGVELWNIEKKIREYNEKICASCEKIGEKFIIFDCNHYICVTCGEAFRKGENNIFEHSTYDAKGICRTCNERRTLYKIVLQQCKHAQSVGKLRNQIRSFLKQKEEFEFPVCEECEFNLTDIEIFALVGKIEGNEAMAKIEKVLKYAKEEYSQQKKSVEETKKKSIILPKNPDGKPSGNKQSEGEQKKIINPYIDAKTYTCNKCGNREIGFYRYMCQHVFFCKRCIRDYIIPKIVLGGIAIACSECNSLTNLSFIENAVTLATPTNYEPIKKMVSTYKSLHTMYFLIISITNKKRTTMLSTKFTY